jgi:ankyrin repeat protein
MRNIDKKLLRETKRGHLNSVKKLLEAGADPNAKDHDGDTALMYASIWGHIEVVKELLKHNAVINSKNKDGFTALMYASRYGHTKIVQALIEAGVPDGTEQGRADINAEDKYGYTALIDASMNGHTKVVRALLEAGANPMLKNHDNTTALMLASINGHIDIVKLLEEYMALWPLVVQAQMKNNKRITKTTLPIDLVKEVKTFLFSKKSKKKNNLKCSKKYLRS